MLTLPRGIYRSPQNVHKSRFEVLCDWIEASVLFDDFELSITDIVDVLIERLIYTNQDFAREGVVNAWEYIKLRCEWIGECSAITIDHQWVRAKSNWQNFSAYSFCLLLSLAVNYDWWATEFGHDYNEQGELFELLTKESLQTQFVGWKIHQTGWSRSNTNTLRGVVQEVADLLGEPLGRLDIWDDPYAKEKGLDLLFYRPYLDKRQGIPVYLVQCASWKNWESKLKTPDLDIWKKIIQFTTDPKIAFSTPFSFLDKKFQQNCMTNNGFFFDRNRLLGVAVNDESWVSPALKNRLILWQTSRIDELLRRSR